MKRILTLATGLLLVLACVGTVAAVPEVNVVTNGGFEDPQITGIASFGMDTGLPGWTFESGGIDLINTYWQPYSGSHSIDLAGNSPAKISQTLNVVPDATYTLTFWLAGNPDTPGKKVLKVYWDGTEVTPTTRSLTVETKGKSHTDMGWTLVTISGLKAKGPTAKITFEQEATDYYKCGVALDEISIVGPPVDPPTPAPEFPSMAFPAAMLVGFMGIILFVQKSRKD